MLAVLFCDRCWGNEEQFLGPMLATYALWASVSPVTVDWTLQYPFPPRYTHAALLPVPGSRFPTLSQVYRTDPYSSQPESFRLADSPSNKENKSESKVPLLRVGAACISIAILPLVSE